MKDDGLLGEHKSKNQGQKVSNPWYVWKMVVWPVGYLRKLERSVRTLAKPEFDL